MNTFFLRIPRCAALWSGLLLGLVAQRSVAQNPITFLGTFHFNFNNQDLHKTGKQDQIDVLSPPYQAELAALADRLLKFRPTIIVIEQEPSQQRRIDSLYAAYLAGTYKLGRNEVFQIGFRVAKLAGVKRIVCVDDFGRHYGYVDSLVERDSTTRQRLVDTLTQRTARHPPEAPVFKTKGILAEMRRLNSPAYVQRSLKPYLSSLAFDLETPQEPFFGVDFTAGWWFNRNLRIFRNLQKIPRRPTDRLLVVYGAGHTNLLHFYTDNSEDFAREDVNRYLR